MSIPQDALTNVLKDFPKLSAVQFSASRAATVACSHALFKDDGYGGLSATADTQPIAGSDLAAYLIEVTGPAIVTFEPLGWPGGVCPEPYLTRVLGGVFPFGKQVLPYGPFKGTAAPSTLLVTFSGCGRISLSSPSEHSSIDLCSYSSATESLIVAVCLRLPAAGVGTIRRLGVLSSAANPSAPTADPVLLKVKEEEADVVLVVKPGSKIKIKAKAGRKSKRRSKS